MCMSLCKKEKKRIHFIDTVDGLLAVAANELILVLIEVYVS